MIRSVDPRPQVLGRGYAHELPELLREVRLVSVTVPRGHGRPVDLSPPVEITNHPLQPLHPGEALGTETDLRREPPAQRPGQHPEVGRYLADRNPRGQAGARRGDEGVRRQRTGQVSEQDVFHHVELLHVPGLSDRETKRLARLQRRLARAQKGSQRRDRVKLAAARMRAREKDRRKDWAEKTSTRLAREFDEIHVEGFNIPAMTRSAAGSAARPGRNVRQKAGLNRGILGSCWGLLVRRLDDKAPGRVHRITPAYTSQRCAACGRVDAKSRKSQAVFACTACGYACHADVNAACNIAAGHAVTARGGRALAQPVNREPQPLASLTERERLESRR